ncbi:hypothetical protein [Candidatus Cetobacterium colombiensis]|uniref:Uncharacterized protein n=1 Tax=Candidatus Cetobacterium colombiensis TaxID=3073100 RepID=A0ABU4WCW3_9FUSO|nr:hypothetical protein [Candidatus Cetobacterium colombiensis]MDX8337367.1 hypothetical protein [Candidatus Cetobacterium colombiensis]
MKIISEVDIMGRWEIAIETNNEQEQDILKEKIDEIGAKFMESGVSEIIVYATGVQRIKLISFVSNNEGI